MENSVLWHVGNPPLITVAYRVSFSSKHSVNVVIWLQGRIIFHMFSEVPSAPFIIEVRAFSTTAQIQFEEPESNGGVPVLKYKVQWRIKGRGSWTQGVYDIQQGQIKVGVMMLFRGNRYL